MNYSVRQLRAFVTAARLGSFTRAAEALHVTQPGLSAMLREFETQLDCRLFERTTRSVALTAQGREFLPTAQRVLAQLEEATASLAQITATQRHNLRVGATPVIASSVIPSACASFGRTHGEVQVEVHDLDRSTIYERVQSGELDAGYGAFLTTSSAVRRRSLFKSPLVLISPGGSEASPVRWKSLPGGTFVGLPDGNPIQQLVLDQIRANGQSIEQALAFNHLHTLLAMVEAGAGSAILPDFVNSAASRYSVVQRPIRSPTVSVDFYEITKAGRRSNDLLSHFSKCLLSTMSKDAGK